MIIGRAIVNAEWYYGSWSGGNNNFMLAVDLTIVLALSGGMFHSIFPEEKLFSQPGQKKETLSYTQPLH